MFDFLEDKAYFPHEENTVGKIMRILIVSLVIIGLAGVFMIAALLY